MVVVVVVNQSARGSDCALVHMLQTIPELNASGKRSLAQSGARSVRTFRKTTIGTFAIVPVHIALGVELMRLAARVQGEPSFMGHRCVTLRLQPPYHIPIPLRCFMLLLALCPIIAEPWGNVR